MGRILLKVAIFFAIIRILKLLKDTSGLNIFLYIFLGLFGTALFFTVVFVLVKDFNILQIVRLTFRRAVTGFSARLYWKMKYKDINVNYFWRLQGGGIIFAYEYVRIISHKIGKVGHIFEYCSGPGFIGFSLLANNLCDRLTLADVNPAAVEAVKETIRNNNLQDRVTVYQSDCLDSIPKNEKWDLVVGNPPWDLVYGNLRWYQRLKNKKDIMVCDPEGRVHEKFFRDINKFLKPDGSILFIEGGEYTNVNSFKHMIDSNGLRIVEAFKAAPFLRFFNGFKEYKGLNIALVAFLRLGLYAREVYFIWVKRKNSEDKVFG